MTDPNCKVEVPLTMSGAAHGPVMPRLASAPASSVPLLRMTLPVKSLVPERVTVRPLALMTGLTVPPLLEILEEIVMSLLPAVR